MTDEIKTNDLYRTSGDAAEQVLRGVAQLGLLRRAWPVGPRRIVDVGAGSGPWGQRARWVWPDAHLIAIETRAAERRYLERWYHEVQIADFRTKHPTDVDLVMGNPPFFSLVEAIVWGLSIVRVGGLVAYLCPAGFGAHETAEELLHVTPPRDSLRLAGRLAFTVDGTDFQHHEAMVWQRLAGPLTGSPSWETHPMPPLPNGSRGWVVEPGRERNPRPLAREFWPVLGKERAYV